MAKFNKIQLRTNVVLTRLQQFCLDRPGNALVISRELDKFLDNLRADDFFGTESQDDPRGDGRDGPWQMEHVQGIDG